MIGQFILNNLFRNLLNTGIPTSIYHSVLIREIEGQRKPLAPVNGGFEYVGVDDSKGFTTYCRITAPAEFERAERTGSCGNDINHTRIPYRLVFFNDHEERSHDDLTGRLLKAVIETKDCRFARLWTIPENILATETNGRFLFTPLTYYTAIDFSILLKLQQDNCQQEISCEGIPNPFK